MYIGRHEYTISDNILSRTSHGVSLHHVHAASQIPTSEQASQLLLTNRPRTHFRFRFTIALFIAAVVIFPTAFTAKAEGNAGARDVYLPFVSSVASPPSSTPASVPVRNPNNFCAQANDEEQGLASLITGASNQQRDFMACNTVLAQVARERAQDMANRNYFGHTNPDGYGPNALVRNAGYRLPGFYASSQDGNNIESIAAGYRTAQAAFEGWMESTGHRVQVLGEAQFYRDQVEFGVGYYYNPNSEYKHYWVFLSAYEEIQN